MFDDSIMKGTYVETTENTLKELSQFQDFLYRNFHNYERYKDIKLDRNQPARLYGTAKTHKFETLEGITVANLKFRPIIDQTGTFMYNAAKIILDYFRPLCKMNNPSMLHKNVQACYLQFHLSKMMRKMYQMMLSHY